MGRGERGFPSLEKKKEKKYAPKLEGSPYEKIKGEKSLIKYEKKDLGRNIEEE